MALRKSAASEGGSTAVVGAPFSPSADRRSALDRAHRGDILGALGRVAAHDTAPRLSWRRRLSTLLAVIGPGLIVMAANNDAGGLAIYAQAGQEHGLSMIWLLLLLAPLLYVVQEMVARLGAVSGAGHARLIFERFGRRWGWFALGDLLLLNLLTIVTEFIGVALALGYFGVERELSVPFAAAALVVVTGMGSFRRWERTMFALIVVSLVAIPLALFGRSEPGGAVQVVRPLVGRGEGGLLLLVVAMIGTTVAPWQLFLQQSNVVDKRITARWLAYERVDLALGIGLFTIGAVAVVAAAGLVAGAGPFADAGRLAVGLAGRLGWWAGALFSIALLNGSLLGAGAVSLATSYAIGDVFGLKHSLHRRWTDATAFHGSFALCLLVAGAVVLLPRAPLGLVTVSVQVLAGVLLPSSTVFLLLLANDRVVLGPWTNPPWLNVLAVCAVGVLIEMSALLALITLFPRLNVGAAAAGLTVALALCLSGLWLARAGNPRDRFEGTPWQRSTWTTPPLDTLAPPAPARTRTLGLVALRAYLLVAATLVVAKLATMAAAG